VFIFNVFSHYVLFVEEKHVVRFIICKQITFHYSQQDYFEICNAAIVASAAKSSALLCINLMSMTLLQRSFCIKYRKYYNKNQCMDITIFAFLNTVISVTSKLMLLSFRFILVFFLILIAAFKIITAP
jgi:hypothetical protein